MAVDDLVRVKPMVAGGAHPAGTRPCTACVVSPLCSVMHLKCCSTVVCKMEALPSKDCYHSTLRVAELSCHHE